MNLTTGFPSASPALQSRLSKDSATQVSGRVSRQSDGKPFGFGGTAINIGADTLDRWKAAYRHIDDWAAALQAIDDYCVANPTDNHRMVARASSWLERRNHANRNDSNEAIRVQGRSF
jgi:hypothetical protein